MHPADIPGHYFCRRSFGTCDVLLQTKEQAAKLTESCITTKFFRLQLEYMGTQRICAPFCNVPANLPGEVVASFLSAYGRVEEMAQLRATAGAAHRDYAFRLCLDREGFQAIPDTLYFQDRQMMVVVEGRRPRCRNCKQVGHLGKICPQKAADTTQQLKESGTNTTNTSYTTNATSEAENNATLEATSTDNEWMQVKRREKREEPPKALVKPNTLAPKEIASMSKTKKSTTSFSSDPKDPFNRDPLQTQETPSAASQETHPTATPKKATSQIQRQPTSKKTPMDTSQNLKRRRESGESQAKNLCKNTPKPQPQNNPSKINPHLITTSHPRTSSSPTKNPATSSNSSNPYTKSFNPSATSPPIALPEPFHSLPLLSHPHHELSNHPRAQSEDRLQRSLPKKIRRRTQSVSPTQSKKCIQETVTLCSTDLESILGFLHPGRQSSHYWT